MIPQEHRIFDRKGQFIQSNKLFGKDAINKIIDIPKEYEKMVREEFVNGKTKRIK
jgi:hypothetical protein